jgi:hypothetical protein
MALRHSGGKGESHLQVFDILCGDLVEPTLAEIGIVFGSHASLAIVGLDGRRDYGLEQALGLGQALGLRDCLMMRPEQRQQHQGVQDDKKKPLPG